MPKTPPRRSGPARRAPPCTSIELAEVRHGSRAGQRGCSTSAAAAAPALPPQEGSKKGSGDRSISRPCFARIRNRPACSSHASLATCPCTHCRAAAGSGRPSGAAKRSRTLCGGRTLRGILDPLRGNPWRPRFRAPSRSGPARYPAPDRGRYSGATPLASRRRRSAPPVPPPGRAPGRAAQETAPARAIPSAYHPGPARPATRQTRCPTQTYGVTLPPSRRHVIVRGRSVKQKVMRLVLLIILAAVAGVAALLAFFILVDALLLLFWKLRSCPRCRQRLAFTGWELWSLNISSRAMRHSCEVNGRRVDRPRVVAACRRCSFEIAIREAPVFD